MTERKKLIEVALPLDTINTTAAREKLTAARLLPPPAKRKAGIWRQGTPTFRVKAHGRVAASPRANRG